MRWRLASLFVIGARNDLPIIEDIVKVIRQPRINL